MTQDAPPDPTGALSRESDREKGGRDPLRAVTESLQRLTGAFTGQNLEEKIQEYTSVYGEILLAMHNRLNDLDRENRSLRKELARERRHLQSLLGERSHPQHRIRRRGEVMALAALCLSFAVLVWQIWMHIKG